MIYKFPPGELVATPGALKLLAGNNTNPKELLERHFSGDYGVVDAEDAAANDASILDGTRILSAYLLNSGDKVWIITEADRSATTILLPEEY